MLKESERRIEAARLEEERLQALKAKKDQKGKRSKKGNKESAAVDARLAEVEEKQRQMADSEFDLDRKAQVRSNSCVLYLTHYKLSYLGGNVQLSICVDRASNVPRMDMMSESDPYVVIRIGPEVKTGGGRDIEQGVFQDRQTAVLEDQKNPVWKQTLNFEDIGLQVFSLHFSSYPLS
mmetsp:Transcript_12496/g.17845  ORF Transcript_12496/g.17845 Transcript_12496/m.17845 type:complete len:178 (-) Transcript_12496:520-1053(-)